MQVGLKDYDPSKDKRFNGTIRLKYCPRPNLKICVLGNANHCEIGAQLPRSRRLLRTGRSRPAGAAAV